MPSILYCCPLSWTGNEGIWPKKGDIVETHRMVTEPCLICFLAETALSNRRRTKMREIRTEFKEAVIIFVFGPLVWWLTRSLFRLLGGICG